MSNSTNIIFKALKIIAWFIFVGLCIEAGGLLVNFIFSIYDPSIVPRLYQKLDLSGLYRHSRWGFFMLYSYILLIALLKAFLFYLVIILVTKLDMSKPFNEFTSRQILRISYITFSIGLISMIAHKTIDRIAYRDFDAGLLNSFIGNGQAFILMAAVVYVIGQIFKRGIDLQVENDLTV